MELALDFEAFAGRPLPPAPQAKSAGGPSSHVPPGKGQGAAADCHPAGQGHRAGIHFPSQDDAPLLISHLNGGWHSHGIGGLPCLHSTDGSVEPPRKAQSFWGSQVGAKAEDTHLKAPSQGEGPNQETSGEATGKTNRLGEKVLPSKGRGEERAASLCDRLLC